MIKACRACVKACGDRHRQRRVHAEDAAKAKAQMMELVESAATMIKEAAEEIKEEAKNKIAEAQATARPIRT